MSSSSSPSPLPPISTLPPHKTYAPSAFPPHKFFESSSLVYPALLIPAKRTGEIQKTLGELVYQEPKRKRVYALEEGIDYTADDVAENGDGKGYDPKIERKLVLVRLGPSAESDEPAAVSVDDSDSDEVRKAKLDKVWQDSRIQSLLKDESDTLYTAPSGERAVRPSYIQLPAAPYSLLTVDQVLRRILPTDDTDNSNNIGDPIIEEVPSSFEIAGHIAHLNLRSEALPYKYLIGKTILEKNKPKIKLVVNKIGTIENEFRTFPMEILAVDEKYGDAFDLDLVEKLCSSTNEEEVVPMVKIGPEHEELMQVEVKEHGCRFHLDFARVYFNSRLQSEHARIVKHIVQSAKKNNQSNNQEECIVADVMAGVGPFAIPLTSSTNAPHYHTTKIICHANDLNPTSYIYLQKNAKLNKCWAERLKMYNLDGREFIHKMNDENVDVDHFIMNLPQMAPEFLDAFRGWKFLDENGAGAGNNSGTKRPMVHVHCFGEKARNAEDTTRVEKQVQDRCEKALGVGEGCLATASAEGGDNEFNVRVVRDVGPRKNMLCVSFRLPMEVTSVERLVLPNDSGEKKRGRTAEEDVGIASKKSKET